MREIPYSLQGLLSFIGIDSLPELSLNIFRKLRLAHRSWESWAPLRLP